MDINKKAQENLFLFSRSENITENDLIPTPAGEDYNAIIKALYADHAEATKKRKATESIESLLHHGWY